MGRLVKVILVHIAITMLIAFVLPSSQSPRRRGSSIDSSSTRILIPSPDPGRMGKGSPPETDVWDYQHNLIRPTYPPQDLQGRYLSPHDNQLASDRQEMEKQLQKSLEAALARAHGR